MPALLMVISPTQPCDGQQVGKTVLMTKYSQPPLFLGRRVPASLTHSHWPGESQAVH